jgi:hypothetical protein
MAKRHFQPFSGCFTCRGCKKKTRDTGDNGGVELCPLCYAKSANGNSLSDAGYPGDAWGVFAKCRTPAECDDLLTRELEKLNKGD